MIVADGKVIEQSKPVMDEAPFWRSRQRLAVRVVKKNSTPFLFPQWLVEAFKEFDLEARLVPDFIDVEHSHDRLPQPLRPFLSCLRGFHSYHARKS